MGDVAETHDPLRRVVPHVEALSNDQSGILTVAVRVPLGFLCGYALVRALPDGYADDILSAAKAGEFNASCHGGVTFTCLCDEDGANTLNSLWRLTEFVKPGDAVIGFDCGHFAMGDAPDWGTGDIDPTFDMSDITGVPPRAWSVDEVLAEADSLRRAIHAFIRQKVGDDCARDGER